ncbi:FAD-binding oxidoreductase [Pseudomonas fulva]|uniref:NAD(P)/FAD-dependent oxidoreductase n=1 Tax=Pseudomonas fulva TaxID=47880 RepID=UPI00201D3423|nr:FAD-binding oxidoreductase [Pseudomonas fulva]UQY33027.1 FAD-binding oxidoreductase [Pseudomonas fulva]
MTHIVVVGAGIVGLSVAHHLLNEGVRVTVVDPDPLGDKASNGNAAGIGVTEVIPACVPGVLRKVPGWLLDPLGPLAIRPMHAPKLIPWLLKFSKASSESELQRLSEALAQINKRVYDDLLPMLEQHGLMGDLHREGALTVYEHQDAFQRDQKFWDLKASHGVEVISLSGAEVREMEPALSHSVVKGIFTPQWSQVSDPKALVDKLRESLVRSGLLVVQGRVRDICSTVGRGAAALVLDGGQFIEADKVVVACGAWSGVLAARIGDRVLLESERGYNSTIARPGVKLGREVIFAERHFVATPLSIGLRIGGAAEFGGLDAVPNFKRSKALVELASMYLPGLRSQGGVHWAGHRPTTPDSLPVIGTSPSNPRVVYAFGHGHLGLTQAATTGRLVCDLVFGKPALIDLAPYAISRFA